MLPDIHALMYTMIFLERSNDRCYYISMQEGRCHV